MNTKQKVFLAIGIFFALILLAFIIPVIWYFFDNSIAYGYVDGNNNGKDDVQEYFQTHPKDYSYPPNREI